jgi:hypothetical protein
MDPKPGRNEPCWCGSGKKYKKCHLAADESHEVSDGEPEIVEPGCDSYSTLARNLHAQLLKAAPKWHNAADFTQAHQLYFDREPVEMDPEDPELDGFLEWYLHDFRSARSGRTLVEEYLNKHRARLNGQERAMLEHWCLLRFGLYEVDSIKDGVGVDLKDLCTGDRYFVHDVTSSRSLVRWDCILARIGEYEGTWQFLANGTMVPRNLLDELLGVIESGSHEAEISRAEFVRRNSHRMFRIVEQLHRDRLRNLQFRTRDGEPIELCGAVYQVLNQGELMNALFSAEEFREFRDPDDPQAHHFEWAEPATDGTFTIKGRIEIRKNYLRLECSSRSRHECGKRLLQSNAGGFLHHLGDSIETWAPRRKASGKPMPQKLESGVPMEIIEEFKARHYSTWPDHPLPALDGKTPRDAVKTEAGRRAVFDLIRLMENGEEHGRKRGEAAFDFSILRNALGLESQ